MNKEAWRWLVAILMAACVGIGFGYAAFGLISIFTNAYVASLAVWLEIIVAIVVATLLLVLLLRLQKKNEDPTKKIVDQTQAERAIWRLSYRRGRVLSLQEIVKETLLDERSAKSILEKLAEKNEAQELPDGTWKIGLG